MDEKDNILIDGMPFEEYKQFLRYNPKEAQKVCELRDTIIENFSMAIEQEIANESLGSMVDKGADYDSSSVDQAKLSKLTQNKKLYDSFLSKGGKRTTD